MNKNISRRELLKVLAVVAGKLGLGALTGCAPQAGRAAQDLEPRAYLPLVMGGEESSAVIPTPTDSAMIPTPTNTPTLTPTSTRTPTPTSTATPTPTPTHTPTPQTPIPPPTGSRVVHVHNVSATSWNGQTDFWNYVNQAAVDTMVDQGLIALAGVSSVVDAWQVLLPDYQPGQAIAIKINLNNATSCGDTDGQIDALIQPVNALIHGLKLRNVSEADIWIYDAIRPIPDRVVSGCLYSDVRFFDNGCRDLAGFSSNDPNAYVTFFPPSGVPYPPAQRISDVLINATYLINVAIMKRHFLTGVSLTFKNHFGTINNPGGLHNYVGLDYSYYRTDYNPLIDIHQSPHIGAKTILNVGDGLFAASQFNQAPVTWSTFEGRVPNSVFLATDAVAMDCVLCDFLAAEFGVSQGSDDYLQLANQVGLGTYERVNPWTSDYSSIDYIKIEQ